MAIEVTSAVLEAMLGQARAAHPREACGLLFGSETAIDGQRLAVNVHPAPHTHFEIDPRALIDAHLQMRSGGPRLMGHYHSHPHGPPEPSATDRALAANDGMIWAIVGQGCVTLWRAGEDGLQPLPYRLAPA
ncbi:MAG: M67 family metallopeptidase [Qipengyuania sp.]|jgi:desampylase|nr:M67 family metallopeptidase [Qipengyuania sp.]